MAHASKPAPSPTSRMQPRVHGAFPQVMTMVFRAGGGCGIRTREGLHPTRFPSLLPAGHHCSGDTARRRLEALQPIMNPAKRSQMRLKLRLVLKLQLRGRGRRKAV
jgi:hypothetical protein